MLKKTLKALAALAIVGSVGWELVGTGVNTVTTNTSESLAQSSEAVASWHLTTPTEYMGLPQIREYMAGWGITTPQRGALAALLAGGLLYGARYLPRLGLALALAPFRSRASAVAAVQARLKAKRTANNDLKELSRESTELLEQQRALIRQAEANAEKEKELAKELTDFRTEYRSAKVALKQHRSDSRTVSNDLQLVNRAVKENERNIKLLERATV